MKRNRYEVGPDADVAGWYVKAHDGDTDCHDTEWYPTKAIAVQVGILLAKNNQPSSLYIKGKNGRYQEERTYGGIDPFPPAG